MKPQHIEKGMVFGLLETTGNHRQEKTAGRIERFDEAVCGCGTVKYFKRSDLKRGRTKHCGCSNNTGSPKHTQKGERFGTLTATGQHKCVIKNGRSRIYDEVICDCGVQKYVMRESMKGGGVKSCGCMKNSKHLITHGDTGTRFYGIRTNIKTRCKNTNNDRYADYGGRGIKCLWASYDDFKNDMYPSYIEHLSMYGEENTTIDRIDNDGHYCKENCRWATRKEQSNNRNYCWNKKFGISAEGLAKKHGYTVKYIRNIYGKLNKNFDGVIEYLEKHSLHPNKNIDG